MRRGGDWILNIEMVKKKKSIGLSRDFIIHPGETLSEVIEDRGMSQRELAVRTGVTEKHISTVIHGQKGISPSFAKKLEYALGIEISFWMNLQSNYERELLEYEELNSISDKEMAVLKNLKEVTELWIAYGWLDKEADPVERVLDYRLFFGISNLLDTPKINYTGSNHVSGKKANADPYVLYAWQKMCEFLTRDIDITDNADLKKLQKMIPDIKKTMFLRSNQIQKRLTEIFSECGIAFRIVPGFSRAPVRGFIKKKQDGSMLLCITLKQKYADIFWATLFQEISHLMNNNTKSEFVDYAVIEDNTDFKVDYSAGNLLIDSMEYQAFVDSGRYKRYSDIKKFADSQSVRDYIVEGRLMNEKIIPMKARPKYEWAGLA